jgi:hypothetical protein
MAKGTFGGTVGGTQVGTRAQPETIIWAVEEGCKIPYGVRAFNCSDLVVGAISETHNDEDMEEKGHAWLGIGHKPPDILAPKWVRTNLSYVKPHEGYIHFSMRNPFAFGQEGGSFQVSPSLFHLSFFWNKMYMFR